jgi:FixJ family two-component response regulator
MGVRLPVIVMTGHGDVPIAVQALKAGRGRLHREALSTTTRCWRAVRAALAANRSTGSGKRKRGASRRGLARLTPRERQVFDRLVAGQPNKAIAHDLGASPRTVEVHRARVMEKMGARTCRSWCGWRWAPVVPTRRRALTPGQGGAARGGAAWAIPSRPRSRPPMPSRALPPYAVGTTTRACPRLDPVPAATSGHAVRYLRGPAPVPGRRPTAARLACLVLDQRCLPFAGARPCSRCPAAAAIGPRRPAIVSAPARLSRRAAELGVIKVLEKPLARDDLLDEIGSAVP